MTVSGNLPLSVGYVVAGADLSSSQFYGVKLDASGDAVLCDTLGEACVGILTNDPASGIAAGITIGGAQKAVSGAAVAAGAFVTVNAAGKFITAASGHAINGVAQSASSADGELITVVLKYMGVAP